MLVELAAVLLTVATLSPAYATPAPTIFAPDVISGPAHDSAPAFTPDGATVYFTRSIPSVSTIVVSHKTATGWSAPTIAPFSGEWSDMEAAMAPDGSYLVFVSNRPAKPGGPVLDGAWNGKTYPGGGGNLWRVDRKGDGWSTPVRLPDTINRTSSTFAPSVVRDGSIYFMEPGADGKFGLYRAQRRGATYLAVATPVSFSHSGSGNVDPAVAPDESYAIFSSNRAPAQAMDLFFVRRSHGTWGTPVHLGTEVNSAGSDAEARLSPDGRTLYFASDRVTPVKFPRTRSAAEQDLQRTSWDNSLYNIWQLDLSPWLDAH
jgi:Tol biopolymer transport system component